MEARRQALGRDTDSVSIPVILVTEHHHNVSVTSPSAIQTNIDKLIKTPCVGRLHRPRDLASSLVWRVHNLYGTGSPHFSNLAGDNTVVNVDSRNSFGPGLGCLLDLVLRTRRSHRRLYTDASSINTTLQWTSSENRIKRHDMIV